ncbi:MAG: hypothetical protein E6Q97_24265 [Desulfurellales bacterium]|nr:MAG: hypothetical protein E6Q97_24265 [Desulfurellales bacterium]
MSFDNVELHDRVALQQRIPKKDNMAHVTPRFFEETKKTNEIDENGLPVFRTIEYVELLIAGDKGNSPVKRVTQGVKDQFPNEYAMWKSRRVNPDMIGDGIPLSLWPLIPTEMAKALEYMNVFTVQQLAALSDGAISKPGAIGLRDMREKAKAFIDSAKSAAPIAKLEVENKELKQRLELMQTQMEQLVQAVKERESETMVEPKARKAKE